MHPLNPASLDNSNINNNGLSIKKNNRTIKNYKSINNESSINDTDNSTNNNEKVNDNRLSKVTQVDDLMKNIFNQNNEMLNSTNIESNNNTLFNTEKDKSLRQNNNNSEKTNLGNTDNTGIPDKSLFPDNDNLGTANDIDSVFNNLSVLAKQNTKENTKQNNTMDNNRHYINNVNTNDELLQKLNYVIYLLEDQRSQKSNYVTEEIILYIFLGVFIIFVIDKFSKPGKYTR